MAGTCSGCGWRYGWHSGSSPGKATARDAWCPGERALGRMVGRHRPVDKNRRHSCYYNQNLLRAIETVDSCTLDIPRK